MIIDKRIEDSIAKRPKIGHTTIYANEESGISVKNDQGDISTVLTSSKTAQIGNAISKIEYDQILDIGSDQQMRFVKELHAMEWKARSRLVATGGTDFFKPADLLKAIVVKGTTQADLTAALLAASAKTESTGARTVILNQDVTGITAQVTVPPDVVLLSLNGSRLVPATGQSHRVIVQSNSSLIGIWLVDMQVQITQGSIPVTGARIIGNKFTGTVTDASSAKVWDRGTQTLVNSSCIVAFNEAEGNAYFFRRNNTDFFRIIGNKYTNPFASGTMIFCRGGYGNEEAFNIQNGGKVGIIALFDRRDSRGYINNRIHNNWLEYISEEGISIDVNGNGFASGVYYQGVMDTVLTVAVASGNYGTPSNSPSLTVAKTNMEGIDPAFHAIFVNTGAYAGTYLRIASVGAVTEGQSVITLHNDSITQAALDAVNLGGVYVSFVIRADGNVYDSNTIINVRDPLKAWGSGWYNTYSRNTVIRTMETLPALPPEANYSNIFKEDEISLSMVSGLNSHNNMVNGNTSLSPSNNYVYNNDAKVGFGGVGYSTLSACEATMDAVPNTISANRAYNGVSPTRRGAQWTSSKNFFNIENLGGIYSKILARGAFNESEYQNQIEAFSPYEISKNVTSSDAVTVVYHNLPSKPKIVQVTPANAVSATAQPYVTWDDAKITITTATAQAYAFSVYAKC